ncbi:hypothetical protein D3C73_185870 [compost metagenome]
MSKISWIQIPKRMVVDKNINALEFCMLVRFKYNQFLSGGKYEFEVDFTEFKRILNISDNRTLKKSLSKLHDAGYLLNEIDEIHRRKPTLVKLNKDRFKLNNNFTQLPARVFGKTREIGHIGLRLLFYYEGYINRKKTMNQFCFASQATIQNDLSITSRTVIEYNKRMEKAKLIRITQHEVKPEYAENGDINWNRHNNHYEVRLDELV